MKIAARTDKGLMRDNNQDSYSVGEFTDGAVYAIVCDGMGGAAQGALASSRASAVIRDKLIAGYKSSLSDISLKAILTSAVESANKEVYKLSLSDESFSGMGTTVVAMIAKEDFVYIAHAGDSRAYKLSGESYQQLTKDHSIVQRMVENGEITAEEAAEHPKKHIITRALGVDVDVRIDFAQETFDDNDIFILCTDGLTNYSNDGDLLDVAKDGAFYKYADRLVNLANQNGGGDNITVVALAK